MTRLTRRALLVAAAGLAGCTSGPGATTTEPPQGPTADPSGTPGGTPEPLDPDHEAVEWAVRFDRTLDAPPTVVDNTVHVAAGEVTIGTPTADEEVSGGSLAALALDDGTTRSVTRLPRPPSRGPTVHDGAVYVVVGGSTGYTGHEQRAVKVVDGAIDWQSERLDQFLSLLGVDDGRAYIGTNDDALAAEGQPLLGVNVDDGATAWQVESGDAFEGRLLDDGLLVSLGGHEAALYDPADGTELWRASGELQEDGHGSVPVVDGAALVAAPRDEGEALTAVDLDGGRERWSYAEAGTAPFVVRGVTAAAELVVGAEYDGALFALDPATGAEAWRYAAGGERATMPAAGDGSVYVGGGEAVHAVDATDGGQLWAVDVGAEVDWVRATEAFVLAGCHGEGSTEYVALAPGDGHERWRYPADTDHVHVAVSGEWAVLGGSDGSLRALRA